MVNMLVLSVLLPLLGAVGALLLFYFLSRLDTTQVVVKASIAVLVAAVVIVVAMLVKAGGAKGTVALSSLYPSPLLESAMEMRWDSILWPLGLSLSLGAGAFVLGIGKEDDGPFVFLAVLLALLAAALAALWSANPLTTILCWAVYDVVVTGGRIVAGERASDAVRGLAINSVSGLLLWAGVLVAGGGIGNVQWALVPVGGSEMILWLVAGLLRIGVYPLHLWAPKSMRLASSLVAPVYLSPVLGWGLWMRLAQLNEGVLPFGSWIVFGGLLTLVGGGVLAWTARTPGESRPWISVGATGSTLVAAGLTSLARQNQGIAGQSPVGVMMLGVVAWILSTAVLFLGRGFDPRQRFKRRFLPRAIGSLTGALSFLGLPGTAGFFCSSSAMTHLLGHGRWGWTVGFFVGEVFLTAAVVRWFLGFGSDGEEEDQILGEVARSAGLVGTGMSLIVVGILPGWLVPGVASGLVASLASFLAGPGLTGWLLWGGAVVIGGMVGWVDSGLRPRVALWLDAVHQLVLLEWVYEWLVGAIEQGFVLLRVLDDVLAGRGALLWSCVVTLIIVLMGRW